jgi:predicted nucleic acid-binding protein
MSVAEIEFGLHCATATDTTKHDAVREALSKYAPPMPFNEHTIKPYAILRAELWRLRARLDKDGRYIEKLPEDLCAVSGKQLGIDERDLIIASVAIESSLYLATLDRNEGMGAIEEAAIALEDGSYRFHVADWSLPLA